MKNALHAQIVSPASLVFEGEVSMVEVPGAEGDFGVLPGHVPMISAIREGVITLHLTDKSLRKFHVNQGYADVSGEGCTILSEKIEAA